MKLKRFLTIVAVATCVLESSAQTDLVSQDSIAIWTEKAAKKDKEAMFALAQIYMDNTSPHYNAAKAKQYLSKAAKAGHPASQYTYGCMLMAGAMGIQKDIKGGYTFVFKAAEAGYADAQYMMGNISYSKDQDDAINWWKKAAHQNHAKAIEKLKDL